MEKEGPLSERSEFRAFPFFVPHKREPPLGGDDAWVGFLWILSLATQRKNFGCRAETRLVSTEWNRFSQRTACNNWLGIQRTPLDSS